LKSLHALTVAAVCAAAPCFAESYKINMHIEPAAGTGLSPGFFVSGAALKIDLGLLAIGPVNPQVEGFGLGTSDVSKLEQGSLYGAGLGLRWRILNDRKGYFFNPGGPRGNIWGNLWLDAHLAIANGNGTPRVGFDVALGDELSLIEGLQVGPFIKYAYLRDSLLVFGLSFSVGWPYEVPPDSDPDGDGIKGAADKCPDQPEDKDGFEDEDGCPDPDNDKDGIPDEKDKCPNVAEDKDGFQDEDGCPEADNDGDGIPDVKDKCPNDPEDHDGFQDEDGCPDPDNDGDGIPDAVDKCPDQPEDKDGFQDEDGCPDPDNDGDGIPDVKDKCPNEPETYNGIEDEDGCPEKEADVYVTKEKIEITQQIFFDTDKATIKPESNKLLDDIADVLKKFTHVKRIRIEGHTDDVHDDAYNMKLSQKRAESVRDALTKRGIEKARLDVQGFGETRPLINEKTDAARAKNRRVEFVIVEQGG
jgi:outer membrane protein OmpA-like peptidoglycan-associated protein